MVTGSKDLPKNCPRKELNYKSSPPTLELENIPVALGTHGNRGTSVMSALIL